MNKKWIISLIGGVIIVLVGVLVFAGISSTPDSKYEANYLRENQNLLQIPMESARKAAIDEASKAAETLFPKWKGAIISTDKPILFYDLNQLPSAYLFKVVKGKTYLGYITISARKDFFPLLGASSEPLPTSNLTKSKLLAILHLRDWVKKPIFLYLGGQDYLARYSSTRGKTITIELRSMHVFSEEELNQRQAFLKKRGNKIKLDTEEAWRRYIQN